MGKTLRISFSAIKARLEVNPPYVGVNNAHRGMLKALFHEFLMIKLNFTYNMFLSTGTDGGYGGGSGLQLPNGTWIGTVGDVISGKADVGILAVNTVDRNREVSFTNSNFDRVYLHFVTARGARIFSPATLLWSFDFVMWTCIGASTLLAFTVFKLISKSMEVLGIDNTETRGVTRKENWGIRHQLFFVMSSYLHQACVLPTYTPLRCFAAKWLFFVLVVTTVYRSKMVSLLAFPVMEKIPTTIAELVDSDYTIGFIKHGDAAMSMLAASTDPAYMKLVKVMEIITGNGLECLERVMERKYACFAYTMATNYLQYGNLSDSDIRKLVYAPEKIFVVFIGLAFESGSIYKDAFDACLSWARPFHLGDLFEAHDMQVTVRLAKRAWWMATNQTDKLEHSDPDESDDLTLKHIAGAFYGLGACLVFCCVVFVQELVAVTIVYNGVLG
ncbi:glutamate receptor ionotropic, delta-2-like [Folsomia candida]|uniref:glutamate receptor ionotropic, delta-2-like n=1 Tax=Folsomia candida TaxID=158441 RepID=UPI001604E773|nr:glutamate receptor ionotropic, delta-2-like [Folsomia candida]